MDQGLEGGALGLADQELDERLDVVHAVLHGCREHPPQKAGVKQRTTPANEKLKLSFSEENQGGLDLDH